MSQPKTRILAKPTSVKLPDTTEAKLRSPLKSDAFTVRIIVDDDPKIEAKGIFVVKEIRPNDPDRFASFHKQLWKLKAAAEG